MQYNTKQKLEKIGYSKAFVTIPWLQGLICSTVFLKTGLESMTERHV